MQTTQISQLTNEIDIPKDGTISRTIHQDEHSKVVLFGFAPGQELSEHTATIPAIIHILEGNARIGLANETVDAHANYWVHMPAGLPHSILAQSPVKMLLTLLKEKPQ